MKRENSISAQVYNYVREHNLNASRDIEGVAEGTGYNIAQVENAVFYLRRLKMLPMSDRAHEFTPEHRKRIGEARATTWNLVKPFVVRNAAPFEIAEITGLKVSQVHHAVERQGEFRRVEEYFHPASVEERKKRVYQRVSQRALNKFPRPTYENTLAFARQLYSGDVISDQTAFWNYMRDVAKRKGYDWFDTFASGITIEGFAVAKYLGLKGRQRIMDRYMQIGNEVDAIWFNNADNVDRRLSASEAVAKLIR